MEQEPTRQSAGEVIEAAQAAREEAEAEQANLALAREFHGESEQERILREAGYSPPFFRN